jgi:hypothetical protein
MNSKVVLPLGDASHRDCHQSIARRFMYSLQWCLESKVFGVMISPRKVAFRPCLISLRQFLISISKSIGRLPANTAAASLETDA